MHPVYYFHHIATTTATAIASIMRLSKSNFSGSSPNSNPNSCFNSQCSNSAFQCRHSPTATLDLLIFILVLFSGAFLVISYFSYIFNSLSLLLASHSGWASSFSFSFNSTPAAVGGFLLLLLISIILLFDTCLCHRSRKCERPGCKGLKKAMEFDLQLQSEECVRSGSNAVLEIDRLPWKGRSENNPDYECLRSELKKMAPENGRAVLLFRSPCGCPVSKLEGWGPKKVRRHKKTVATVHTGAGNRR